MTSEIATTESKEKITANAWLDAAYHLLIEQGVDAVKIMPIAKQLGVARTSFYWYFPDREALLQAMIARWEAKNTGNLITQMQKPASTITQAMLQLFDCWLDDELFDSALDLAIRNWARNDSGVNERLAEADERRITALSKLFESFGYSPLQAEVRSKTVLYTQIGYIFMQILDEPEKRLSRIADYVIVFTGQEPTHDEITAFEKRHPLEKRNRR